MNARWSTRNIGTQTVFLEEIVRLGTECEWNTCSSGLGKRDGVTHNVEGGGKGFP